jgi:hypothetical protein
MTGGDGNVGINGDDGGDDGGDEPTDDHPETNTLV